MKRTTSNAAAIKKQNTAKSHKLLKAAMRDRDLSSTAKGVLYVLLFDIADGATLRCNPSFETIAERVGRTRRAIVPAVQELRDRGWITYESTQGGSARNTNRFTFNFNRDPVKDASPLTSEQDFTGEANVARGEEDCTRTYSEPLSLEERGRGVIIPLRRAPDGAAGFEEFWDAHPHSINQASTRAEFNRIVESGEEAAADLIAWAKLYAEEMAGKDNVFGSERWLKERKWRDQPRRNTGRGSGKSQPKQDASMTMWERATQSDSENFHG